MGRTAAGVWAMRLRKGDLVTGFDVVRPGADLFVLHELGCGKRVRLEEYATKGRYIQGVWTTDHSRIGELGPIVAARVVDEKDQITIITGNGIMLRTPVSGIRHKGRAAQGVRIVSLDDGDTVAALAVLRYEDLVRKVEGAEENGDQTLEAVDGMTPMAAAE
jgi:DNA gyrase subunit A